MANFEALKSQFSGKKVLVAGLGLQGGGTGIAEFFARLGAQVTVTDLKTEDKLAASIAKLKQYPITYHLGGHRIEDFSQADVIFKTPKMRWDTPEIMAALEKNIPVEMELSFFVKYFRGKIIGITGSRGKSTTTQMIYDLLKGVDFPVTLAGSIPDVSTINLLSHLSEKDWVVMELPSWPLSGFHREKISPHVAVFTNFYPDHLDYYLSMDEYLYDKKAIYQYQSKDDYLVVNEQVWPFIQNDPIHSNVHIVKKDDSLHLKNLKGEQNLENASAAFEVIKILKLNEAKARELIENFEGLPYRQQVVKKVNAVTFVNDTTSTTPVATIKAIAAFSNKPIVLILGGNSKQLPYEELLTKLADVQSIVLLAGSFTKQIQTELEKRFNEKISIPYESLEEAVIEAYNRAKKVGKESYVLFSPGATSFSMFNNEFHRGQEFNRIVTEITQ